VTPPDDAAVGVDTAADAMRVRLPRSLLAPAPTWARDVDVVVLGSGAAGLSAALAARPVRTALIVTKDTLDAGSTAWAQGGLAGVLHPDDSLENHVRDTLAAGAGLCDEGAVRFLVTEAPKALQYLMRLGAAFDAAHEGEGPRCSARSTRTPWRRVSR
jgi:aspartate oxidase